MSYLAAQKIPAALTHLAEIEPVLAKQLIRLQNFIQIRQPSGIGLEPGVRAGTLADHRHHLTQGGAGLCIAGIRRLAQRGVLKQEVGQAADLLQSFYPLAQGVSRVHFLQRFGKGVKPAAGHLQGLEVPGEIRVGKTMVQGIQIPTFVHIVSPFLLAECRVSTVSFTMNWRFRQQQFPARPGRQHFLFPRQFVQDTPSYRPGQTGTAVHPPKGAQCGPLGNVCEYVARANS